MGFDANDTWDSIQEGISETAEAAHVKTKEFHEKYVSKVTPDMGKYGDVVKFAVEMVPGVSEYNAIKDGDWQAFLIAAGIDIAAIAVGAFTAGAGYAAVKGGTSAAKAGVKVAVREVAEAGAKKVIKETAEAGTKKVVKEVAEAGAEKFVKDAVEAGVEKAVKETTEAGTEKVVKEIAKTGTEKVVKETAETGARKAVLEVGDKIDKTRFPEYIDEIEKVTNREIPANQKKLLEKALKENDYSKLSKEVYEKEKRTFRNKKPDLIKEWEKNTGQEWPKYTKDVLDENKQVLRLANQPYDAHHIIEISAGGQNEWWNLHPASFPNEHQKGIHAAESIARQIFG